MGEIAPPWLRPESHAHLIVLLYLTPQPPCSFGPVTFFSERPCTRGGVEDTRLEAKAKDTKKIRGQGQAKPFRGQTLSRPRTGMLEAKEQGHKRKCSPKKKKVFTKIFQAISKKEKKRSSQKFFKQSPQKNVFQKIFQALHKILTIQKIVLSSSRGQANFRGLQASRPRPRTSKCVLEDVLEDSTSALHNTEYKRVRSGSHYHCPPFKKISTAGLLIVK